MELSNNPGSILVETTHKKFKRCKLFFRGKLAKGDCATRLSKDGNKTALKHNHWIRHRLMYTPTSIVPFRRQSVSFLKSLMPRRRQLLVRLASI